MMYNNLDIDRKVRRLKCLKNYFFFKEMCDKKKLSGIQRKKDKS